MKGVCSRLLICFGLGIAILSCARPLPQGMGSNHEIVVVADSLERRLFEGQLQEVFEKQVRTPQIERVFALDFQAPQDFDFYRRWKNLLLLSSLRSEGQTAQLIKTLLAPQALKMVEQDSAYLFVKKELWAREQVLVVLTARDNQALGERLNRHASEIFEVMERSLDEKIEAWLYAKGEESKAQKQLWKEFGWSVRLPSGYKIEKQSADSSFVWIRKRNPDRWLFVHWEDFSQPKQPAEKEFWVDRRDRIGQLWYQGDQVVLPLAQVSRTIFGGREAVRLDGLWQNKEQLVGGPFRTWFFADSSSGRSFMIDTAVFAPAFEKEPYLRHLQIIARTFSTNAP